MKCFEIYKHDVPKKDKEEMNLKHEMFWNALAWEAFCQSSIWTLNMKCFEIITHQNYIKFLKEWTLNMKCFERAEIISKTKEIKEWTLNMKCFEISVKATY